MKQILIVCTANICRSPMVEGLVRARLAADGMADRVAVGSAGVFATYGQPADAQMATLLALRGIDLTTHGSRPMSAGDLRGATLIVVMEEVHRQAIFHRQPQILYKVYLLSELAGEHDDLPDPHGGPQAGYQAVLAQAELWLAAGWPRLVSLLER